MQVHHAPYGRPAAALLHHRIAVAKADDPLRPVSVVVPTNPVGVATRRLLAGGQLGPLTSRGNGIAGLGLLTVYRLAELLGAPRLVAAGRRPVSTPVVAAAVRQVLAAEPGPFAAVRTHPSTEEALVRAHRELSELRPSSLDRLAARSARAAAVVGVHRAVRARLEPGWFEEADLLSAACAALRAGSPLLADLGTVMVYLPQDLSLPAAELVRTVAAHAPVEVVAGRTGVPAADADVDRVLRRLGLSPPPKADEPSPPTATAVVTVSDAEEEARSAVQRVVDAARGGVPLERMAICYPSPEPYARILAEQLAAAEVPSNGLSVRRLSDRLLGRWLLDLLDLPERRFARPAVMGLLAPTRASSGAWERISREAGVVHDRHEWTTKLTRLAAELRQRAEEEEAGVDARAWLVDRLRRDAAHADALRAATTELFEQLAQAVRLDTWQALARWCAEIARRHLGGTREHWPDDEREAADRVEAALDRLAGLDALEPATDAHVFRRSLALELDNDLGRAGAFGHGVLVGTPSGVLGVDLDQVVVLGLAEGVLPTRPREDSLLADADRAVVADELPPRARRVGVEQRHLLAALAAARRDRILVFPRGDLRRSVEHAPSRWLLDSVQARTGQRVLPGRAPWLEHVASFAQRARTGPFPATRQLYGLRALAGGLDEQHPLVAGDDVLGRAVALLRGRASAAFTRFDGNLAALAGHIPSPAAPDRIMSASQLETWLACPHAYFMRYLLRVEPVENPEELLEITALERGSLVHAVLERWLCELLAVGVPAPFEAWPAAAHARMQALAEEACRDAEQRGVTGHPLLWRRDRQRVVLDLARFVGHDDARRGELRATPVGAEHPFGLPGSCAPPLVVDLGDGRSIRLRGRIDRVDRAADGTVVVADYKTGSATGYAGLAETRPLGDGTRLQLAIYGLAAGAGSSPVRSEYWFTSSKGGFVRVGYPITDAVVTALRHALRLTVDGIAAGRFPLRPPEPTWRPFTECRYCDPDDLGTSDRYRDWQRIRRAPELAEYVALVEATA